MRNKLGNSKEKESQDNNEWKSGKNPKCVENSGNSTSPLKHGKFAGKLEQEVSISGYLSSKRS